MADAGRSRRARTTVDGGAGRCLSDLSDDLLRHILFLAPDKEGASTTVLSRRWRWLWRTSGAVYLDTRSFIDGCSTPDQESQAFLRGAEEALAAAATHGCIRRLRISVAEDSKMVLWTFRADGSQDNLIESLFSIPAARRVEELQIEDKSLNCVLSFGSLPSEAIRVLRIIRCSDLTAAPPPAAFPMLVDLHLQDCSLPLVDLQSIVDAAPRLSTLNLASTFFSKETNYTKDVAVRRRLLIPALTALVLADCTYYGNKTRLELDVPSLQYFRYKGHVEDTNRLSLKSQASTIHVDLHLTRDRNGYSSSSTPTSTSKLFWRFLQSFNSTKLLKLRMDYSAMVDLALVDKTTRDELVGGLSFSLVERLELEAEYYKPREISVAMLADLLHCCPMVRDLRIKHTKLHQRSWSESSTDMEALVHFDKSVSGFMNLRRTSIVSLAGQNDEYYEAFDIPGLTGEHSISCLQGHLKGVSLQFFRDEPYCLGAELAKFFARNAMVLQELHIDDGCQEMLEHVNFSVRRWIANTDNANNQLVVKD